MGPRCPNGLGIQRRSPLSFRGPISQTVETIPCQFADEVDVLAGEHLPHLRSPTLGDDLGRFRPDTGEAVPAGMPEAAQFPGKEGLPEEGVLAQQPGEPAQGPRGIGEDVLVAEEVGVFPLRPDPVVVNPGGDLVPDPCGFRPGPGRGNPLEGAIPRPLRGEHGEGISHDMKKGALGLDPVGEIGLEVTEVFKGGRGPVRLEKGTLRAVEDPESPELVPFAGAKGEDIEREVEHVVGLARPFPAPAGGELAAQQIDHQVRARTHVRSDHNGPPASLQGGFFDHRRCLRRGGRQREEGRGRCQRRSKR